MNRNARIKETSNKGSTVKSMIETLYRDDGLYITADVRERDDVESGRSLTGITIANGDSAHGWAVNLNGRQARTLLRVLQKAVF
jgi:hypothetical protein